MLPTTEQLIEAARNGDKAAFAELVRRFERAAWVAAWRVLREHHATQDAIQNAFVEAYCKLAQLRSPARFGVWLMRISHREAMRLAKRPFPARSWDAVARAEMPAVADPVLDCDELLMAVGSLPEHERLVIALRYFNGHSVEEVARETGRPVGTVTKQLSRALARLKSLLGNKAHVP